MVSNPSSALLQVALEKWIAGVHDEETARLAKLNELESYLYKV